MAARAAARNITDITDVGTMPYEVAYNVLKTIKNPLQLFEIEQNCPHIADADAELWKDFIKRDIPNWKSKMLYPKNPRSWNKVYRKLMREEELIEAAQEDALRKQLAKDTIKKSEQSTTYVPQVVSFAATVTDARAGPSSRGWSSKPKSGEKIVSALRRQTAEAHKIRQPFKPAQPGSSIAAAKRQISHAPAGMIPGAQRVQPRALLPHQEALLQEHQRLRTDIVVPASRIKKSTAISTALTQKREVNEKKLRELTNSRPAQPAVKKFELTPPRATQPTITRKDDEKTARVEAGKNTTTLKRKHIEEQPSASPALTAKSASPQPASTSQASQESTPIKRKRPAATNIFMAKKQKR